VHNSTLDAGAATNAAPAISSSRTGGGGGGGGGVPASQPTDSGTVQRGPYIIRDIVSSSTEAPLPGGRRQGYRAIVAMRVMDDARRPIPDGQHQLTAAAGRVNVPQRQAEQMNVGDEWPVD
jgi:hypothetical protein